MNYILKIILAISLLSCVGCWSAENTNSANLANTITVTNTTNEADLTNTVNAVKAEDTAKPPSATDAKVTGSPMEVLKSLHNASVSKNPAAIKKTLSKSSLAMIEESAKNQRKTVDRLLREDDGAPFKFKELPEMRNEKINGSLATVEVKPKDATQWESIPFIAEDGEWKVMLDVIYRNLQQQFLLEEQKKKAGK